LPDENTQAERGRKRQRSSEVQRRSSEVERYNRIAVAAPVSALIRLWRALTHSRRRSRRTALPRCQHCGYLIAPAAASPTGWAHGPHWKGIRCPGDATEAEPVTKWASGR
jgi:hypothetical protein